MIYLKQNAEFYNNDIRAMLQAFFDNEKVVVDRENTRLTLAVEYIADSDVETQVSSGGSVTFTLEDEQGYSKQKTVVIDYLNKKIARNPLKAALYRMLSAYTGKELPWGSLTGVRPTKIATELLERGETEDFIHKVYTDTYLTIPQKADICIEVAKKEQKLFQDFCYEEEYCIYIGIPFCPTRCLYCSLTSYPVEAYQDRMEAYLQAL